MLQCFSETGEPVQDFQVEFDYDQLRPNEIRRVVHVEGAAHDYDHIAANAFVGEIKDPFLISTSDYLYLNAEYDYSEALRELMVAAIRAKTRTGIEVVEVTALGLTSTGLPFSANQIGLFRSGRPLWRRSALSCKPGRGKKGKFSTTSNRLRDALLAWLVFAELMARHAAQVDTAGKNARRSNQTPEGLTNLAKSTLANALGFFEGTKEGASSLSAKNTTPFPITFPALGIEQIRLKASSRQLESSLTDGRTRHFRKSFGTPRKTLTKQIQAELRNFKQVPRMFGSEFDSLAVIQWAGRILIYLRIALAASLRLDRGRATARKNLIKARTDVARQKIVGKFTATWLRGVAGTHSDGGLRDLALEELLDLQIVAFIAMATGLNPRLLFPYVNYGIYDTLDEDTALTTELFNGAIWLGELFRKRSATLDRYHAQAIVTSCNPGSLPRGLPQERKGEWLDAIRLATSFMTEAGLERLMEVANDVVNDGVARDIYALEPAQWRPAQSKQARAKAKKLKALEQKPNPLEKLRGHKTFLPVPIAVEAGWLLLPGDYRESWFGQSSPFWSDDAGNKTA
jgi:hypothetical protein